jgi:hypothetical protein
VEAEELLRRYATGERNFSGVVLNRFTNLAGVRLPEIDLSGATLTKKMQGIDLIFTAPIYLTPVWAIPIRVELI